MDEKAWRRCTNPSRMLNFLRERDWTSDRKLRLACCAFCRQVWHHLTDKRYRAAVEVAERHADGLASDEQLRRAHGVAVAAAEHTDDYEWSADKQGMLLAANAVGWATTLREPRDPLAYLAGATALGAKNASVHEGVPEKAVRASQSAELRDILGPLPFRRVAVGPAVLAWHDGVAPKLAQAIYDERSLPSGYLDNTRLGILADALEEAGASGKLLEHLRLPGPHVRGCHALDAILGRG